MIPAKSDLPGWPEFLTDKYGDRYARLRDGKSSEDIGEACLYGLLDAYGVIDRAHQWIPVGGSTEEDMRLSGGSWSSAEQLESHGQTPIVVPPEPVEWPA